MRNKIAFLFILLAIGVNTSAQEKWSLQKCIQYALEHNIQVKQTRLNVALNENNLLQSKIDILPTANGSASHAYNFGRSIDPTTNEFVTARIRTNSFSVSSNLILFGGFRQINNIKRNEYALKASQFSVEETENDITLAILNSYLQILFNQDQVEILQEQMELTRQQLNRTQVMVEVGQLPQGSLLDIQSQLANEELNLINAQNLLDQSRLNLELLLELDITEDINIEEPDLNFDPESMEELANVKAVYDKALEIQPSIKSAEFQLLATEKGLAVARGAYYPQLSLFGSLRTNYSSRSRILAGFDQVIEPIGFLADSTIVYGPGISNPTYETIPFSNQLEYNFSQAVGIQLSIPILNGWQTRTSVNNAKITYMNDLYSLELVKNQLQRDVQQAYADAKAAQKSLVAAQKSAEAMEKAFEYSENRYNEKLITAYDYQLSKNNYTRSLAELTRARYDYIFSIKILDFYQGKPITLN